LAKRIPLIADRKADYAFGQSALRGKKVLRELALMGINAGSLFPGLDRACNQFKERFFDP
jgi:hypothetical protein